MCGEHVTALRPLRLPGLSLWPSFSLEQVRLFLATFVVTAFIKRWSSEPAFHRRQRRRRTAARTQLRTFIAGTTTPSVTAVWRSIWVLNAHHSRSALPQQAARLLANMSWQCQRCKRESKPSANSCGGCGLRWDEGPNSYSQQPPASPWQETPPAWSNWEPSLRQAAAEKPWRRRQSPRRPPKRGDQSQAKAGSGKGGVQGSFTESAAKLPPPPKPPPVPKAPPATAPVKGAEPSVSGMDAKLLEALISHTRPLKDVPPGLQQMLEQHLQEDAKSQSKRLHALVSQQQTARAQLRKIHADKVQFETSWEQYLQQLAQTLEAQTKERATAIQA